MVKDSFALQKRIFKKFDVKLGKTLLQLRKTTNVFCYNFYLITNSTEMNRIFLSRKAISPIFKHSALKPFKFVCHFEQQMMWIDEVFELQLNPIA